MATNPELEIKECKQFAQLLEQYKFYELKKYLTSLKLNDYKKYQRFFRYIDDLSLWAEISKQKISLAIFVSEKSKVVAYPEDRTRIVVTLSRVHNKDLSIVNKALVAEFGDYLQLAPVYQVNGKAISYKDITGKASSIINGLKNLCSLSVQDSTQEIMFYFKNNSIGDKAKLIQVRDATFSLMMQMRDALHFISPGGFAEARPELINYYKMTNRAEFDIKSLDENPDFDEISKFVYVMAEVVSTKLKLMEKNLPINDYKKAEEIISNNLASIEFRSRISLEEVQRAGMPLPRKK